MGIFGKDRVKQIKDLYGLSLESGEAALIYLGYSGVILRIDDKAVAFDVADLMKSKEIEAIGKLDVLLFTHDHGDHYRFKQAVEMFKSTKAHVVAEPRVFRDLEGKIPSEKLIHADPGETHIVDDAHVNVLRGIHKGPINLYHLKVEKRSIFHGGDSGYVPLKDYPADLAFLPTGAPSPTASPENALRMALELKPRTVVTVHGSIGQHEEFQRKVRQELPEINVTIPEQYSPIKIKL